MRFERIVGRPRKTVTRSGGWRKSSPAHARLDDTAPPAPAARRERSHVRPGSYIALSLLVSATLFAVFLTGDRGFLKVRAQRAQIAALQSEITELAGRNEALEKETARLRDDPAAVEKVARERLHLVAPGDVVLVLPEGWRDRVVPRTPAATAATPVGASPTASPGPASAPTSPPGRKGP